MRLLSPLTNEADFLSFIGRREPSKNEGEGEGEGEGGGGGGEGEEEEEEEGKRKRDREYFPPMETDEEFSEGEGTEEEDFELELRKEFQELQNFNAMEEWD